MKIIISISNLFQIFQAMSKAIFEYQQKRLKKKKRKNRSPFFKKLCIKTKGARSTRTDLHETRPKQQPDPKQGITLPAQ